MAFAGADAFFLINSSEMNSSRAVANKILSC